MRTLFLFPLEDRVCAVFQNKVCEHKQHEHSQGLLNEKWLVRIVKRTVRPHQYGGRYQTEIIGGFSLQNAVDLW